MDVVVKTKQWGNSVGVVLPKKVLRQLRISSGDDVVIHIKRRQSPLRELFGSLRFSKPTKQLLSHTRQGAQSKWLKNV